MSGWCIQTVDGLSQLGYGIVISPWAFTEKFANKPELLEEQRKPFLIDDKAKAFFNQRLFWWNGQFYTRSDLIKFLANKLGGVHYELGRDKTDARIEEIQNHFGIQYRHEKRRFT